MQITDIRCIAFRSHADRWDIGHGRLIPQAEVMQTITCIDTDERISGYFLGGGKHGDQDGLNSVEQELLTGRLKSLLVGQDPFDREMIWKWLWVANSPEVLASVVDLALWDLAGRATG